MPSKKHEIVIVGGGIIGCSTAYYISRHPSFDPATTAVHLLEASKIAGGASGKAGGLLALWAYPSNIVPLSFNLHSELAKDHDGERRWGYRRVHSAQLDAKISTLSHRSQGDREMPLHPEGHGKSSISLQKRNEAALGRLSAVGFPEDLNWIDPECIRAYEEVGDTSTTAQVHPYQFTTTLAQLAAEKGVKILEGAKVERINEQIEEGRTTVQSVTFVQNGEQRTLQATHVVLSAGPWTRQLRDAVPVEGLRAHSIVIRPTREVSPYALFTAIDLPQDFGKATESKKKRRHGGQIVSPEIYARPFGEVYACGDGDILVPLPDTSVDVQVDASRCQDIIDYVGSISKELRDGEVIVRQACYLPVTSGGSSAGPFIGELSQCKGLVVAAGHSCWGIQNGPGTGKLVSEILLDGRTSSATLGKLDAAKVL